MSPIFLSWSVFAPLLVAVGCEVLCVANIVSRRDVGARRDRAALTTSMCYVS